VAVAVAVAAGFKECSQREMTTDLTGSRTLLQVRSQSIFLNSPFPYVRSLTGNICNSNLGLQSGLAVCDVVTFGHTLPPGTVPGDNKLRNILLKRIMPFDEPPFRFFFDFGSGLRVRGACSWNLKSSAGSLKYLSETDREESQRSCQICIAQVQKKTA
jgi:hypothetical protein